MVKNFNNMEQGMVWLQEKLVELDNERMKQSISIDQLIWGNITTKQTLHRLPYLLNNVHAGVKQSSENSPKCPSLLNSASQSMEGIYFLSLLVTPNSYIKKWYKMLCLNLLPIKYGFSLQP